MSLVGEYILSFFLKKKWLKKKHKNGLLNFLVIFMVAPKNINKSIPSPFSL